MVLNVKIMTADLSSAYTYTDFNGLSKLRAAAKQQSPEATRETAKQFEALFIQMMMKSMRQAMPTEGGFDSEQVRFYQEMFDQQMSLELAKGRGIGLADSIVRQLERQGVSPDEAAALRGSTDTGSGMPLQRNEWRPPPVLELSIRDAADRVGDAASAERPATIALDAAEARIGGVVFDPWGRPIDVPAREHAVRAPAPPDDEAIEAVEAEDGTQHIEAANEPERWPPDSADAYVRQVWPHAERAAARLGVDPEVLVAQSALETGWGRHVMRHADGRPSFNLFGIKADTRWQGERVAVSTLEYVDGIAERQRAWFRAYGGPGESFDDYANFIQQNPRYRHALEVASEPEAYVRGLQDAGYATDPAYADKILTIMRRGTLQLAAAELKNGDDRPIT